MKNKTEDFWLNLGVGIITIIKSGGFIWALYTLFTSYVYFNSLKGSQPIDTTNLKHLANLTLSLGILVLLSIESQTEQIIKNIRIESLISRR